MKKFLKTIFLFLIVNYHLPKVNCQLLTNDNVNITLTNGAQITVQGDIQNNAGTTIDNNGTIDLIGNWTHNAANNCFGTSTGTVIFNGANQNIGGANSTTFNNLQLAGTGIKTLQQNISVGGGNGVTSGTLDLTSEVLDLNSNSLTITNPSTNAIAFSAGYILSELVDNSSKITWQISTTTGVHTIPFGNMSAVQIPFTFNLTSGYAGDVTVCTYPVAPDNTPYPVTPVLITHVRNIAGFDNSSNTVDRFWEVDPTGNPTASLTFTYAPSENAANGNINMRAQRWNLAQEAWETPLAGQVNPTSQSVLVSNVTTFGPWAIATEDSPLPVELISFAAKVINNKEVLCKWVTASEINNDYFTVERSRNGDEFEEVGKVDGAGNSTSVLNYSLTDYKPFSGISYYRLKQTDFNGDYSYSQMERVLITDRKIKYLIYPNPSNGNFSIQFNAEQNINAAFSITDATGRLVQRGKLDEASGVQNISLQHVLQGFYFLQITNTEERFLSKIQVIR